MKITFGTFVRVLIIILLLTGLAGAHHLLRKRQRCRHAY
jgi:uncharacterized membrane protein